MEKVVVIGGTGHIGTYLIPQLVEKGYQVVCVSRSIAMPYFENLSWKEVEMVALDRFELEKKDQFGQAILDLNPSIVIDLICFELSSAQMLVNVLKGKIKHFLHCGSMWVHGFNEFVPTVETQPRKPISEYGEKKVAIETFLLDQYKKENFPSTMIHPGHIVGEGWWPVNPQGNFNPKVFQDIEKGATIDLPNLGLETLHHVHAIDVASAFVNAIEHRIQSIGQSFNIAAEQAMTFKGFATAVSNRYKQTPTFNFLSWDAFKKKVSEKDAQDTLGHLEHSTLGSIEKAKRLINYKPKYTALEAVFESLDYFKNTLK